MPSPLSLGGKSPADKKKKPMPSLLMAKAPAPPPEEPNEPEMDEPLPEGPPKPSGPPMPPKGDPMGKMAKDAHFVDQTQTCSTCEYFDDAGDGGVGACTKGVPEADYSVSDPTASRCRFYEGKDDAGETPVAESAEMEEVPA